MRHPMLATVNSFSALLPPAEHRLALRVTRQAQRTLHQGHPWLFDRSIVSQSAEGRAGDLAVIFDDRRRFLAIGLYDPSSPIRVRVLQHNAPATIDAAFLAGRLATAVERRARLAAKETTGYRLVHGEGDELPGLVIDRYDRVLVMKLYTPAWLPYVPVLLEGVAAVVPAEWIVLRMSRAVQREAEPLGIVDGATLTGASPDGPHLFVENGLRFEVDVLRGQKTGFFLDQRDNRARVETLAAGKEVLNVFAYTGGFSLYAARGGASSTVSLDISVPALEAAQRNLALNEHLPAVSACQHEYLAENAFTGLARLAKEGRRFDLVVVDPPSFAQQQSAVPGALHAYERLAKLALGVMRPGGTLVAASCSSRVNSEDFFASIRTGASRAGRVLHEFDHTAHPLDHPVRFPEMAYLKCLYALS